MTPWAVAGDPEGCRFAAVGPNSPNQVLTHAARAAAKQLFRHLWWPRAKGSGQVGRVTSKGQTALDRLLLSNI